MGNWERQYFVVEPGDRDVHKVAGCLRASLASVDRKGLERPERDVWVENEQVYWDSHERLTGPLGFLRNVHSDLDVPCEWMVGVSQVEGRAGGASLYIWVDDGFVHVETTPLIPGGDHVGFQYLKTRWGIDPILEPFGGVFSPLPDRMSADQNDSHVSDETPPLARFATHIVDESVETREDARTTLVATAADRLESAVEALVDRIERERGRKRIDALEQLYAAAASSIVPIEVTPRPVLDLLDGTGREAMLAAAVVQELSNDDAIADIGDDSPTTRRQAARYLGLMDEPERMEASIVEGLSDEEPHVRAGVARTLFKSSLSNINRNCALDGKIDDSVAFDRLTNVVDDEESRVRASAVLAVASLNVHNNVGDVDDTLSAIAAALDGDFITRRSAEWVLGTAFWIDEKPWSLKAVTAAAIRTLSEEVENLCRSEYLFDPEILDAALAQLADEGWELAETDTGTLVAVAKAANEPFESADRIREVLLDRLPEDPVQVTEALVSIADDQPTYLEDAISKLTGLVDEEKVAATEALAMVAGEYPEVVRDCWSTVEPVLKFEGEHARPAAEVVAALAAEDPNTVVAGPSDTRDIVAEATSAMCDSLGAPGGQADRETVGTLISLAVADRSVAPSGIEPYVDRNSETTDEEETEMTDIEDRDVLADIVQSDPEEAANAFSSLLSSLDPEDDSKQFHTVLQVIRNYPGAAVGVVDQLIPLLTTPGGQTVRAGETDHSDDIAAAVAAVADHDPAAVRPYIGTLLTCIGNNRMSVNKDIAEALAAVEQATPNTLPPSLSGLADTDRGEGWPIDILAASRPDLVGQMVRGAVSAEHPPTEKTSVLLTTVARHRPGIAETGVTRLVERADSVGCNSSLWSVLESVAESHPELAAIGLEETVENTVESVDLKRGDKPAQLLVVLAEQYPRRVWALLKKHTPENDLTALLDRTRGSRVEEKIEAVLDVAGPEKPVPEKY